MKRNKICCICGKELKGYGNDPWPIREQGRCCDTCNEDVVEARIRLITYQNPD